MPTFIHCKNYAHPAATNAAFLQRIPVILQWIALVLQRIQDFLQSISLALQRIQGVLDRDTFDFPPTVFYRRRAAAAALAGQPTIAIRTFVAHVP
ncbi:MAG: hypothetical protein K8T89_15320 [Planctomycetes bacterium]|nr:hypothetical protein [Planctomycetota bacterium]